MTGLSLIQSAPGVLLFCGAVSYLLGWPILALLMRYRVLDRPTSRSSHEAPMPRGGGLGILLALAAGCGVQGETLSEPFVGWVLAVMFGVALVSFVDDVRGLGASVRLLAHLVGGILLLVLAGFWDGAGARSLEAALPGVPVGWLWPVLLLVLVGHANAFNFMDGINGIAGGQAVLTAAGMAVVGGMGGHWGCASVLFSLAVCGAALGFLPHNFPRARMFMGDVGSVPLGMLLAFISLWICRERGFALAIPLALMHANFLYDTSITLVRRFLRGDRWHRSHREHFYQLLVRAGWSHTRVTGVEMALSAFCIGVAVAVAHRGLAVQLVGVAVVVPVLIGFCVGAERTFRRSVSGAGSSGTHGPDR